VRSGTIQFRNAGARDPATVNTRAMVALAAQKTQCCQCMVALVTRPFSRNASLRRPAAQRNVITGYKQSRRQQRRFMLTHGNHASRYDPHAFMMSQFARAC